MEIVTKRFRLRDFQTSDTQAFEAYHSDPRFLEFYGEEESKPDHAHRLIEMFMGWAEETPRQNYQQAIVLRKETQSLVGCCAE